MVHNGIEYGDMQMIAEAYSLLRNVGGIEPAAMSEVFAGWNEGELSSYLVEITASILARVDDETGRPLVDLILDAAGQKGTGKWTGIDSLMLGAPVTAITEAVFARALSALKEERVAASRVLPGAGGRAPREWRRRSGVLRGGRSRRRRDCCAGKSAPIRRPSPTMSAKRSTHPRSAPTRRGSNSSRWRRQSTAGGSIWAPSP